MSITIRDIAKAANVSHTTVSLVLNRRGGRSIPAPTRQRVIDAAAAIGYQPNQFARALASGRTNVIEVRGIRLYDPYYVHILMSLQATLADEGYQVIISPYSPTNGGCLPKGAVKWPVDGIVAIDESAIDILHEMPGSSPLLPIVCLGAYVSKSADAVTVDLAAGVTAAMRHLRDADYRNVAYLADILDKDAPGQRETAYEEARRADGQRPQWIISGLPTRIAAWDAVLKHVERNGVPDAILCRSDSLAIGALRALGDLGVSVPDRTAVIGCNGIEEAKFTNPQISTIEIPVDEMCRHAWQMLRRRMSEPGQPRQSIICNANLVVRGSSEKAVQK